jgi:hypothetical protein
VQLSNEEREALSRNIKHVKTDWQIRTDEARDKLKRLYSAI